MRPQRIREGYGISPKTWEDLGTVFTVKTWHELLKHLHKMEIGNFRNMISWWPEDPIFFHKYS